MKKKESALGKVLGFFGIGEKEETEKRRAIVKKKKRKRPQGKKGSSLGLEEETKKKEKEEEARKKETTKERSSAVERLDDLYGDGFSQDFLRRYVFVEGLAFASTLYGDGLVFRKNEIEILKKEAPIAYRYHKMFPEDVFGLWEVYYLSRYIYRESLTAISVYQVLSSLPMGWRRYGISSFTIPPKVSKETRERLQRVASEGRKRGEISENTYEGTRIALGYLQLAEQTLLKFHGVLGASGSSNSVAPIVKRHIESMKMLTMATREQIVFDFYTENLASDAILFSKNSNLDFALWKIYDRAFSSLKGAGLNIETENSVFKVLSGELASSISSLKLWYVVGATEEEFRRFGITLTTSNSFSQGGEGNNHRELLEVPFGRLLLEARNASPSDDLVSAKSTVSLTKYFWMKHAADSEDRHREVSREGSKIEIAQVVGAFQQEADNAISDFSSYFSQRLEDRLEDLLAGLNVGDGSDEGVVLEISPRELLMRSFFVLFSVGKECAYYLPIGADEVINAYIEKEVKEIFGQWAVKISEGISRKIKNREIVFRRKNSSGGKKRHFGDSSLVKSTHQNKKQEKGAGFSGAKDLVPDIQEDWEGEKGGVPGSTFPGDSQKAAKSESKATLSRKGGDLMKAVEKTRQADEDDDYEFASVE